jgi:hypothetical protein
MYILMRQRELPRTAQTPTKANTARKAPSPSKHRGKSLPRAKSLTSVLPRSATAPSEIRPRPKSWDIDTTKRVKQVWNHRGAERGVTKTYQKESVQDMQAFAHARLAQTFLGRAGKIRFICGRLPLNISEQILGGSFEIDFGQHLIWRFLTRPVDGD